MAVEDLTIKKGATYKQNLVYKDNDDVIVDLTGVTARMQIRHTFKSDVIHELTTENGGITITGAIGEIDLLILATVTDTFPAITGVYDLELILGTDVERALEGNIFITENTTR
jgi:hypothetical protein